MAGGCAWVAGIEMSVCQSVEGHCGRPCTDHADQNTSPGLDSMDHNTGSGYSKGPAHDCKRKSKQSVAELDHLKNLDGLSYQSSHCLFFSSFLDSSERVEDCQAKKMRFLSIFGAGRDAGIA